MPGIFTNLMRRIVANLVSFYRYAIDYVEDCDSESTNMVEIETKSQSLQAYEIY
jgi:hypothetical protein